MWPATGDSGALCRLHVLMHSIQRTPSNVLCNELWFVIINKLKWYKYKKNQTIICVVIFFKYILMQSATITMHINTHEKFTKHLHDSKQNESFHKNSSKVEHSYEGTSICYILETICNSKIVLDTR